MNQDLATRIGELLLERGFKLALAESCTGGLVGDRITNIPGSSEYFQGGIVAYAYQVKADLLGVSWESLDSHGAVSREVVVEMAMGARKFLKADVAASISGIAGPGGGTPAKPVGTVWLALVAPDGSWTREFHFPGDRMQIKAASADAAMQFIVDYLEGAL